MDILVVNAQVFTLFLLAIVGLLKLITENVVI